jgi:hypothetical protein
MYLVPFRNRDSLQVGDSFGYFGKVVQLDLEKFGETGFLAVRTLDLTMLDPSLVGFSAGLAWGSKLLLVPMRNAQGAGAAGAASGEGVVGTKRERAAMGGNHVKRAMHGKLVLLAPAPVFLNTSGFFKKKNVNIYFFRDHFALPLSRLLILVGDLSLLFLLRLRSCCVSRWAWI